MQLSTRSEDFLVDVIALRPHVGPVLAPVFADTQVLLFVPLLVPLCRILRSCSVLSMDTPSYCATVVCKLLMGRGMTRPALRGFS